MAYQVSIVSVHSQDYVTHKWKNQGCRYHFFRCKYMEHSHFYLYSRLKGRAINVEKLIVNVIHCNAIAKCFLYFNFSSNFDTSLTDLSRSGGNNTITAIINNRISWVFTTRCDNGNFFLCFLRTLVSIGRNLYCELSAKSCCFVAYFHRWRCSCKKWWRMRKKIFKNILETLFSGKQFFF